MKLSIITINYNNLNGLCRTIESVQKQSSQHFEWIIVDGASTDGSVDAIKEIPPTSSTLQWISEPDTGIYQAMNKGVQRATGDYLLFLNSGDELANDDVIKQIEESTLSADIIIGYVNVVNNTKIIIHRHSVEGEISLYNLILRGIPHQGVLINRSLQLTHPYDENYRINSDLKFFLQTIILENCSVQYIPLIISNYDAIGISSTHLELQQEERRAICEEVIPPRIWLNYKDILPHYYEVIRVQWLLQHPILYRIYRAYVTICRKLLK